MYQNNFFILKIIFDINTSKLSKNIKNINLKKLKKTFEIKKQTSFVFLVLNQPVPHAPLSNT
jgi:hypothetical protein